MITDDPSVTLPMSRKMQRLIERLAREFAGKQVGHCVRVDHLSADDARFACAGLRALEPEETETYVLSHDQQDDLHIPSDRAIELRNRKRSSLCLFVPADLQDVAVSSLGNSFAPFDLPGFLRSLADDLHDEIPRDLKSYVAAVFRQLRGAARVPVEDEIDYLSAILDSPTLETAGAELWRVGLIPDFSDQEDYPRRLDLNRQSVDRLARPARPHSSVAERVASLKLAPNTIQTELSQYLIGKRLQSDREWLHQLTEDQWRGRLTFDQWVFPKVEPSDLERIDVVPFSENGIVRSGCGLKQAAPGTVPYAECGARQKVTVRWDPQPSKPTDVAQWRIELIPDRDKYDATDAAGVDLPQATVRGSAKSAKVSLDLDPTTLEVREVQARVVALDANGSEILDPETNDTIEGISQSFYLEAAGADTDGAKLRRLPTFRCLPDAVLSLAMRGKDTQYTLAPLPVEEKDLAYFPFMVNERSVVRVATTPFLRQLQEETLANPALGGRYGAIVTGVDTLDRDRVEGQPIVVSDSLADAWAKFTRERKHAFDAIREQKGRGLVETADVSNTLCRHVRAYAKAYCDLLDAAGNLTRTDGDSGGQDDAEALLALDTLRLEIAYLGGRPRATVILPTHPLRLLWYVAYAEWVSKITGDLLGLAQRVRAARFNEAALAHLAPLNLPALLVRGEEGARSEIFADNLGFFHAICVPLDTDDPGTLLSEVGRVLGFGMIEPSLTDLQPKDVGSEIKSYLDLHTYLKTLRVNAINPGSGEFLRLALDEALAEATADDETLGADGRGSLHLDLITHTESDVQTPAPGLEAISEEWYRRGLRARGSHLRPGVQVSRRTLSDANLDSLPGGDVHLTLCLDHYKPRIAISHARDGRDTEASNGGHHADGTSAAIFGLLTHFQTQFFSEEGAAVWERKVVFEGEQVAERHPVNRAYSDLLVEGQEAFLRLSARLVDAHAPTNQVPALRLEVGPEERRIVSTLHQQSDWVLTVDRHFGVEYYDTPTDTNLATQAKQYLLDYTPEFLDGLGHRLVVTTQWKEEVADVIARAMDELGLARDERSCAELLATLKMISGRLALRLIGNEVGSDLGQDSFAKETVSLAVVANYLQRKGELQDTIVVPLDAHKRLFLDAKQAQVTESGSRCDLLLVRPTRQRLFIDYVEVKYRIGDNPVPTPLLDQIADQTLRTDQTFRSLYFADPPRLDSPILRCQLAAILRFYAERAYRHGRVSDPNHYAEMLDNIRRVEMGFSRLTSRFFGYVVNLDGQSRRPFKHRDNTVTVLTGIEVERDTSFRPSVRPGQSGSGGQEQSAPPSDGASQRGSSQGGGGSIASQIGPPVDVVETPDAPQPVEEVLQPNAPAEQERRISSPEPDDRRAEGSSTLVIPLGRSVHSDAEVSWTGSVSGSPHLFVLGIPGQGKSWAVLRLLSEVTQRGVPALIFDFHGQFGQAETPFATAARPSVLDVSQGLPFSPFEASAGQGGGTNQWRTNAFQVAEIIEYVFGLGDMQRDLVYEAIRDCYQRAGYECDGERVSDLTPPTMAEVFSRLTHLESERRGIKNTVARCRMLFEFDMFREEAAETLAFHPERLQTTVIDLHRVGIETMQMAAGAFVLRKLYKDMFVWGETDRLRLLIVLDEAHRLAKDTTLPKIMKEGRKFGIAVVVASQNMQDFRPEVLDNAGTKVIFRTNYPLSKRVAGYLKAPHFIPDVVSKLEGLDVGHALIQTPQMATCAEVEMYPYDSSPAHREAV